MQMMIAFGPDTLIDTHRPNDYFLLLFSLNLIKICFTFFSLSRYIFLWRHKMWTNESLKRRIKWSKNRNYSFHLCYSHKCCVFIFFFIYFYFKFPICVWEACEQFRCEIRMRPKRERRANKCFLHCHWCCCF